ncbi:MAG TPA: zinc-binding dehydrogenase [Vicinamibacterales bacterium]|nr:zinc-binding dehydrogenase [Vicinamibacterales bacterium]
MKAVVLRELGPAANLRLDEVPDPVPGAGEVVVRLKAAALNHRDVWIRLGQYAGIKVPIILGSDGAGEVAAVGAGVDGALVGRAVVIDPSLDWGPDERAQGRTYRILGLPDDGTYAQRVKVPAANVHAKPAHLSFEEAAALPLAGVTAYRAVVTRARVQTGETVVVTGIGGGVSSFALQIARSLGARVFVTSGSDEKLARARESGAQGGVNHRSGDWVKALAALTGGGPDVVIDSVGGETFNRALELARPGGRIVTYGATSGAVPALEVRRIFWKQLNVLGSTMGTARDFADMLALYERRALRPVLDRTFALADAPAAHQRMERGEQSGKIVLTIE